jgi:hypothetical protein
MGKDDKQFEAKIKGMYSGVGCACQTGAFEKKKTSLKKVMCKNCGRIFKTDKETDYCFKCMKQMKEVK